MKFAEANNYLHRLTPKRDAVLRDMEKYAAKNKFPIIGPLVGRFLCQMARLSKTRDILELGSGYGYSAYWFSRGMNNRGNIIMTDSYAPNKELANMYFTQAGIKTKIDFRIGDSLDLAGRINAKFDIVLNDIDKKDYPRTIEIAARLLKPGGLFITDNILWGGRVFDSKIRDADTRGVRKFTKQLYADERFFTTVMPIRDGIAVALKIV